MADAMWKQVHGQSERIDYNPSNTLRQGQTTRLSGTCKNCLEGKATCLRKRADSSSGSAQQVKACWAHGDEWLTQCGSRYMVNPKGLTTTLSNTLRQGQTTRLSGTCKNCLEGKATCLRKMADSSSGSGFDGGKEVLDACRAAGVS
jgi:Fe-S cluster biogenesis protein NfuA